MGKRKKKSYKITVSRSFIIASCHTVEMVYSAVGRMPMKELKRSHLVAHFKYLVLKRNWLMVHYGVLPVCYITVCSKWFMMVDCL